MGSLPPLGATHLAASASPADPPRSATPPASPTRPAKSPRAASIGRPIAPPRPVTVVYAFLDLADGGAQRLTLAHCRHLDRRRYRPEILCVRGSLWAVGVAPDLDPPKLETRSAGSLGPAAPIPIPVPVPVRDPRASDVRVSDSPVPDSPVPAAHAPARPTLVPAARAAGLPVHVLGRLDRPFDLAAVPIIAGRLRSLEPGIVHVPLYSRAAPYVILAARLARVPLVVAHEWSRARPPSPARRIADRLLEPGTRFVAVSERHARELVAGGVAADHVRVVIDGVDTEAFRPRDRDEARAELGLPLDRPIVLVPARLHPAKGHADLLAALPALRSAAPDLLVLLAGDGPLRETLPADALAAGLPPSAVRFLGHRADVHRLMAASDLVVLPSHVEGLPSAMLEAFASARPVVATDVGGVGEALVDGHAGRLIPPRDPEALAAAITALLADPALRDAMGRRGRALALARFRAEDATRRLEAAYEAWL